MLRYDAFYRQRSCASAHDSTSALAQFSHDGCTLGNSILTAEARMSRDRNTDGDSSGDRSRSNNQEQDLRGYGSERGSERGSDREGDGTMQSEGGAGERGRTGGAGGGSRSSDEGMESEGMQDE